MRAKHQRNFTSSEHHECRLEIPQTFTYESPRIISNFPATSSCKFFVRLQLHQGKANLGSPANHPTLEIQSNMSANVNNLELVHNAFNTLLSSLTPAQMSNFTQQLRADPVTTTRISTTASTPVRNQDGLMTPASTSPVRQDKRAARAKVKETRMERRKLRPLNAFMAFRCKCLLSKRVSNLLNQLTAYYSSQLPGLTQKTKSSLMRCLWEQDHWK